MPATQAHPAGQAQRPERRSRDATAGPSLLTEPPSRVGTDRRADQKERRRGPGGQ